MERDWQQIEAALQDAAGLEGDAFRDWVAQAPHHIRELLADGPDFGPWAAEAAAQLVQSTPRLRLPCMLGHYRVVRQVASGGMGEVYEAEDERLQRKVAIKVLHTAGRRPLAEEARKLGALRHPNICRVFDIGQAEGVDYFVMEILDGAPLSDRLRKGPLPLHEALRIGRAVAGALAEAHRAGIVHRDVKPANILMTRHGPSLVDFGIAEWTAAGTGPPIGTPSYMAPEQALGISDPRSDIYSAGCVLREMTGPDAPAPVGNIIDICVRREPDERWQSAADLACALEWLVEPMPRPSRRRTWIASVALASLAAAALLFILLFRSQPEPPLLIPLRGALNPRQMALSPDGTRFAFTAPGEGGEMLIWIRKLTEVRPEALAATVGASLPFWSPDGRFIGMFRGRTLQTLDLATGALRTLTDVAGPPQRAVWGAGDQILYCIANIQKQGVIYRIPASGGAVERVTELNAAEEEHSHRQPVPLPGGSHFLYVALSNLDQNTGNDPGSTYLAAFGSAGRTLILREASPVGAVGDRVYYLRNEKLWSQRLNARKGEWVDAPKLEADNASWAGVTPSGHLWYLPAEHKTRPIWTDRRGKKLSELPIPEGKTLAVGISKNGNVVVTRREDQSAAVGLWVIHGADTQRIGSSPGGYIFPVWSSDGKYIYFGRGRGVYRRLPAVGAQEEALLSGGAEDQVITTSTPNGEYAYGVAYNPALQAQGYDIFRLDLRSRNREFWSATPANETQPALSPDGRWMAWLCEHPTPGRLCISPVNNPRNITYATASQAMEPSWSADGTRLYFLSGGVLCSARVSLAGGRMQADPPERLFGPIAATALGASYAVGSDEKFLVREVPGPVADPVLVWNRGRGPGVR